MLSRLKKPILKKLRNSLKVLLFSIILLKIVFLDEKKKNLKSLKDKKDVKNNLDFRIADEKSERIKRLNMNVN